MTACSRPPLRLLVRIDGGAVGFGHSVRTAGLLAQLAWPLDLVVAGDGAGLDRFFPTARFRSVADHPGGLAGVLAEACPDAILVDLPRHDDALWRTVRALGRPVICIDDEGGDVVADLVLNGTVLDRYHHYPALPAGARALVGPSYTMLRPAFSATPWRDPAEPGVAMVIGSGERAWNWAHVLTGPGLDRSGWGKLAMVVGAAFPDMDRLAEVCAAAGITLHNGLDAADLARLLADAQVALITGGMIVYEALAVGVPTVVFPLVANMPPEIDWLKARGCVVDLGYDGGMDMERVGTAVGGLIADRTAASEMSRRGRAVIDGKGMARAAAAVAALLEENAR